MAAHPRWRKSRGRSRRPKGVGSGLCFGASMICTAEFWSPASNVLVFISTLAVLIGLILEGEWKWPFPITNRARAIVPLFSERASFGETLVTLGVAGELLFGVTAFVTTAIVDNRQKREILSLQQKLAHRHLDEEQVAILKKYLAPIAGRTVWVSAQILDFEASSFAKELIEAFKTAGLDAKSDIDIIAGGNPFTGVAPAGTLDHDATATALVVLTALRKARIVSAQGWTSNQNHGKSYVEVNVGSKPSGDHVEYLELPKP